MDFLCLIGVVAFAILLLWVFFHGDGNDNVRG